MGKKYENDFKVILVELLQSGRSVKELSDEYGVNGGIIKDVRQFAYQMT